MNAHKKHKLAIAGGPKAFRQRMPEAVVLGIPELFELAKVIWSKNLNRVDGKAAAGLEMEMARTYGVKYAMASTSGTAAIHVALATLDLDPYSEVITSPITDMGTVIPILACGCRPIFADVDSETGNLTLESIQSLITARTRAIILVHLFGRPVNDLLEIKSLADQKGIALIEDCSQAHLAEVQGHKVGTVGQLGCLSFQQSKQMTCGDGGVTLTNDVQLAERAALFSDKGWQRSGGKRCYSIFGMNYRITELQAAVALAQLRRLPALMETRRHAADFLCEGLSEIDGIRPPQVRPNTKPAWWKMDFAIDEKKLGVSTDLFCDALLVEGVPVSRHYLEVPIFDCEAIRQRKSFGKSGYPLTALHPGVPEYALPDREKLPGTYRFIDERMTIHWGPFISERLVARLLGALKKVVDLLPKWKAKRREISSTRSVPVLSSK